MKSYINTLLTNEAREDYKKLISSMFELCPEMMSRKIPEANVQQAFVLATVGKEIELGKGSSILCAGSYEDTATECLGKHGIVVTNIDPNINMDLHTFVTSSLRNDQLFGIVFSTSVLEHVQNDEEFIRDICEILEPGGTAILTMDFQNSYISGNRVPVTDVRFYTKYDLDVRIREIVNSCGCGYVNDGNWEGQPDFWYEGFNYSFATLVFRKEVSINGNL